MHREIKIADSESSVFVIIVFFYKVTERAPGPGYPGALSLKKKRLVII